MGKVTNLLNMIWIGVFLFCQTAEGQNNPYKIDDQLYSYFQQCNQYIKSPKVLLMADTLFNMAGKKNDIKAQCLAKNLKTDHYYYTNNIDSLLTEKEKVADFARNTPFKQYIFGAWNRIITYYLLNREYEPALQEIKKYQDEAIRLNVPYGIGQSYIRMGDVYYQQRMCDLAIKQYIQAMEYYQSVKKENELYHAYYNIGTCYISIKQYEEAEKYTLKSIETAPTLMAKAVASLSLLRIYTATHELDKAEKIKNKLIQDEEKGLFKGRRNDNYYLTLGDYYIKTNNLDKALAFIDSVNDEQLKAERKSRIYAHAGNFEKAYMYLQREIQILDSVNQSKNSDMLASYNARFNSQRLELEKNRLSLQNTEMELKQVQNREQMVFMEREQSRIELENRNLQLDQQRTATELEKARTQKQRLELKHKQEELRRIEMEKTANKRMGMVLIAILTLITGFSIIYALTRHRYAKRLLIEKEAAETARKQAEKADKLKSAFLQNMSHEIRTPLNAIVGFNDILNDSSMELGQEERQELLSHLHTNTDLLLTLVNDVLDLSKLESGNYNISLSNVSLPELCESAIVGVSHRAHEGVQLLFQQPPTGISMITDGQRLQQILNNLLINACKYTQQGSITLTYEQKNDHIRFSVTDTGCGIDKDKAEIIFQRFEKLDSFKTGFGLGLSICRSLTQALGGEIYLDTHYTDGARFVVEFPLQSPA